MSRELPILFNAAMARAILEQDLERIYTLRDLGYSPYVMIYDKYKLSAGSDLKRLQRWVNSRFAFAAVKRFEDYK